MNKVYKKDYDVVLRSFITRAFFGTIVASGLLACGGGGVSKEELEAAKEETENVKKELGDKITALEGKAPADINAAQYTKIQSAVGLTVDGDLDKTNGLAKDVADLQAFIAAVQGTVGLDPTGNTLDDNTGLAKQVKQLADFKTAMQTSVGLGNDGTLNTTNKNSLNSFVRSLRSFRSNIQKSVGVDINGNLHATSGLSQTVSELPSKIVKGVNASITKSGKIDLTDL